MIEIKNLSFSYSKNEEALHDISLQIDNGEFVILLGPNGNGKTTLLKCLDDLLNYKDGHIYIDNKDIKDYKRKELSKIIGYVPQILEFTDMSVFDTIMLGRIPYITLDATKEDYEIVTNLIKEFHLEEVALKNVNHLSGGERQKVAIARLLAGNTKILLFDEPTSNLDIKNQLEAMNIIKKISTGQEVTTIVTLHDMNLALRYGTHFVLMKDGRIVGNGNESIITNESIKDLFGVDANITTIDNQKVIVYKE